MSQAESAGLMPEAQAQTENASSPPEMTADAAAELPQPQSLPSTRRFAGLQMGEGLVRSGSGGSGSGGSGSGGSGGASERTVAQLREQLRAKDAQIAKLAGTLQHYRNWALSLQARYQIYNPDAARPARRTYVGGLPPNTQEAELRQHMNELMRASGGAISSGFPVASCKIYTEKNYAFLEFRSVEEASNCMALDGVAFKDTHLKIRRPNNYDANLAVLLGVTEPDPTMDLSKLNIVKTVVQDSPHKLFIGGLPCDWTEEQVKELLLPFGALKAFNLVMDKNTGNSKGYAFCEYVDTRCTDDAVVQLNSKPVGTKFLTVKRALGNS